MTPSLLSALMEAKSAHKAICLVSSKSAGALRLCDPAAPSTKEVSAISDAAERALRTDKLVTIEHGGETYYITPQNPPVTVFIVGAVHIAQALLPMLDILGMSAIVIDPRGAFASEQRFKDAEVDPRWPDEALNDHGITKRSAIVALTHDPKLDDPALQLALRSDAFYIGALGSTRTHAKRLSRLMNAGFSEADLSCIRGPIGLNIGASNPAEIALSIAAQILETLRAQGQ